MYITEVQPYTLIKQSFAYWLWPLVLTMTSSLGDPGHMMFGWKDYSILQIIAETA